jgi:TPP-dependent pyruvate/acetoin dehydrogenase alpha subunit
MNQTSNSRKPAPVPTLSAKRLLDLYYYMKLDRQLEDRLVRLHRQNQIPGGLYSSFGQEAIPVGSAFALEHGDWIAPMIRNIGGLLVHGVQPREIFMQHMGKLGSPTQGKDGTNHFGDIKDRHIVAPISMLGDLIPVMAGVAMAGRYLGQNIVSMTWIGDGGSSTGAFHEGLNFAAVQRAPFVLILENNQWAYSTPVSKQTALKNLADKALGYGILNRSVDGNDVLAVYDAAKWAVDESRAGRGPVLIEAKTMRMKGHAQHDGADYVPDAMRDHWKANDPIARFEKYLFENHLWDESKKAEIDARIERELDEDQKFAEESPAPPAELASQGVYCDGCHTIEADWRRAKEEVMPPASSTDAVWEITDFGAMAPAAAPVKSVQKDREPVKAAKPQQGPPKNAARIVPKQPMRPQQPQARQNSQPNVKEEDTIDPALRVPFGRGPARGKPFEPPARDKRGRR